MMAKAKPRKIGVTMRAVIQRINRKLALDLKVLKTTRGDWHSNDLGHYYMIDLRGNYMLHKSVDPEELAHKLGVLKGWEAVTQEDR
jgi:hypothetical protein